VRVVVYCDGHEVGGAEISLARLLGALPRELDVAIIATHRAVLEHLGTARPAARTRLLRDIASTLDLAGIARHAAAIRSLRPDVLHVSLNRPWGSHWAVLAGRLLPGVRVVLVENSPRPPVRARDRLYLRAIHRHADVHVAPGEASAALVRAAGVPGERVRIIPTGVEDVRLTPLPRLAPGPVVGCIARLDAIKGIDVLIRAVARLPDVTLAVVGDGPEREPLGALADELGVADRVLLTGWSDRARDHLTTFDVFALASRFEAWGIALVEAMLAGVPVVATDVGGVRDVVVPGETGLLVPAEDPAALAEAIGALLEDAERRRHLAGAARRRALERFRLPVMARRYAALYTELVATRR
jgi:glycosyltransferase involved in cell wall biosynthesis